MLRGAHIALEGGGQQAQRGSVHQHRRQLNNLLMQTAGEGGEGTVWQRRGGGHAAGSRTRRRQRAAAPPAAQHPRAVPAASAGCSCLLRTSPLCLTPVLKGGQGSTRRWDQRRRGHREGGGCLRLAGRPCSTGRHAGTAAGSLPKAPPPQCPSPAGSRTAGAACAWGPERAAPPAAPPPAAAARCLEHRPGRRAVHAAAPAAAPAAASAAAPAPAAPPPPEAGSSAAAAAAARPAAAQPTPLLPATPQASMFSRAWTLRWTPPQPATPAARSRLLSAAGTRRPATALDGACSGGWRDGPRQAALLACAGANHTCPCCYHRCLAGTWLWRWPAVWTAPCASSRWA